MNTYISSIIIFLILNSCTPPNIKVYNIGNVLNISVSNELEIQTGSIKLLSDEFSQNIARIVLNENEVKPTVVWQQSGLNDKNENAFNTFVRLQVGIESSNKSQIILATDPINISELEFYNLKKSHQKMVSQAAKMESSELIGEVDAKIEKIGKYNSLRIFWQVNNSMYGLVNYSTYILVNNKKIITIGTMFNESDKNIWSPLLDKSLNSIEFLN